MKLKLLILVATMLFGFTTQAQKLSSLTERTNVLGTDIFPVSIVGDTTNSYKVKFSTLGTYVLTGLPSYLDALAIDASPDGATDYLIGYDTSASAYKRILINNLPGISGSGVATINGESGPGITLALGTAGTDAAISASSNTLTLDLPSSSAANRGLLTSADWSTFNAKQPLITGSATTIDTETLTVSRALVTDGSGKVAVSTTTGTELGYVSGVTSAIQTQLDAKQATITGSATTIDTETLTVSRALVTDGSGKVGVSATTATELGYVSGVTSAVQTQLDAKQATITGSATTIDTETLTVSRALVTDGSGKVGVSATTSTELGYVSGVTSAIQTQLDAKGSGDVTAASTFGTDNVLVRSDGTSKGVQSTGVTVDDSNNISGVNSITLNGSGAGSVDLGDSDGSHFFSIRPNGTTTTSVNLQGPAAPFAGYAQWSVSATTNWVPSQIAFGVGLLGSDGSNVPVDVDTEAELETALGGIDLAKIGDTVAGATLAATSTVIDGTDATSFVLIADSATGSLPIKSDAGLTYDASTAALFSSRMSLGTTDQTALLTVAGTASFDQPLSGTTVHFIGANASPMRFAMDTYNQANAQGSQMQGRRAGGSAASPNSAAADDVLLSMAATGYGATGWNGGASSGLFTIRAEGEFTDTSKPTYFQWFLAPTNSLSARSVMRLASTGDLQLPFGITATEGILFGAEGTGLRITSDGDGAFTMVGAGNGSDEDLTHNLDDTANNVIVSSSTGVTNITYTSINLTVPAAAYDATAWNGNNTAPTRDDVRDKIASLETDISTTVYVNGTAVAKPNFTNTFHARLVAASTTNISITLPAVVANSDAATVTTDASLGTHFRWIATQNFQLANPTNPTDGQRILWEIIQDGTGSRTISFDTKFAFGTDITGVTLTTTLNKRDFITAVYNSTADKWYVVGVSKGY